MASLTVGPLSFPGELVLLGLALALASGAAWQLRRRWQVDVAPQVWRALWLGLLVARVSFVLDFAAVYADAPWQILNVRDGGWDALAGWLAVAGYTAWLAGRHRPQRRALWVTLLVAAGVWWGGTVLLVRLNAHGPQLPALSLGRLEAGEQLLADFAGRPVVLNLWATWCPPCQREMPALQRAQQQYPGVHFVFANQHESRETVQRFLALKGLVLHNVLLDEHGALARHFQERALPTTFFFDASGALVDVRTGELSDASLAQRLARWPEAVGPASVRP
ncbi:TlpA family protein disulfide reductase [Simplicispira psychrophila]|uniref:TlpA family protein disulfide reductase n=1 Tax=Simplicispira psychrophila TaxID=80882 RepID=UPI000483C507|nr:TlpA disulfide reductase family protein [Simplicispira psychrophila]